MIKNETTIAMEVKNMDNQDIDHSGLEQFLLIDKITDLTGKSRATIYRWCRDGEFPGPYKIGGSSLWKMSEYVEWAENLKRLN